jgi:hypothetical protein
MQSLVFMTARLFVTYYFIYESRQKVSHSFIAYYKNNMQKGNKSHFLCIDRVVQTTNTHNILFFL